MDAVQQMEQLTQWEWTVRGAVRHNALQSNALESLLKALSQQIADRDAEIQRLRNALLVADDGVAEAKSEIEILRDELKDLKVNRRGIISQAHQDRADLYAAQDRLEQMGENERF